MILNSYLCLMLQPIGDIAERFRALCLKDSGVLYEDPYIQVTCGNTFIHVMQHGFSFADNVNSQWLEQDAN